MLGLLFVMSLITYLDRVCISTAKEPIAKDLALGDEAMGMVFGAFALGYALAQIPSGMFVDRFGPRAALTIVVSVWSLLTAFTGAAWNLASLVTIRFLFGIGEAGAFPGAARAITNWLPVAERGHANGIMFSGTRLGGALAFPLLVWMMDRWQWRMSFVILGAGGCLWALAWFLWFRNDPPGVAASPARSMEPVNLGAIFRSKAMLLAMGQYFASNFTFFLCLSWMHPYLKRQYALTDGQAAGYAMAPLLAGATSLWISGFLVDRIYASRMRAWSRRLPAMIGFGMSVAGLLLLTRMTDPFWAVVCFTAATLGSDMTISPSWTYCADIGGNKPASVSAAMNMVGNIGSFVSANAFPLLFAWTGTASAYFLTAAALNLAAILCWWRMRSVQAAA
jgi:MFS transporter, ACS family, glucarate transporter